MKKLLVCLLAVVLASCSVGGNVNVGGGSRGVGVGAGISLGGFTW